MRESLRMQSVQSPIIPVVGELIRANPGTISLGQGVAYYGPPPEAAAHIEDFLADPENHKYKLVQGIPELLEQIEQKLDAENDISTDGSRIVVTAGANMGFVNANGRNNSRLQTCLRAHRQRFPTPARKNRRRDH
jgi:aspartate/methionine/tyrosine aminotransferase